MERITVLFDGWPLVYHPNSPAALHLLALLACLPPEIHPQAALPADRPGWMPAEMTTHSLQARDTAADRLRWQQLLLPRMARELGVDLAHLTDSRPPLFPSVPGVVSPTGGEDRKIEGFAGRFGAALAHGGMARLEALLWPADLPSPGGKLPVRALPPMVHPAFFPGASPHSERPAGLDLPETFILYHGPCHPPALRRLLNAWSWAADAISSLYPLLVLGAGPAERQNLGALLSEHGLDDTVWILPTLSPDQVPALYQHCSVLFHPARVAPWGGAVRHALACGKPIVAMESPLADALVGPAAYLIPGDRSRQLGAALITAVVEEEVATTLAEAARRRADGWNSGDFGPRLHDTYRSILHKI